MEFGGFPLQPDVKRLKHFPHLQILEIFSSPFSWFFLEETDVFQIPPYMLPVQREEAPENWFLQAGGEKSAKNRDSATELPTTVGPVRKMEEHLLQAGFKQSHWILEGLFVKWYLVSH